MGLWTRKLLGCFEQSLIGCPSRSMEESVEGGVDCGAHLKEFPRGGILVSGQDIIPVIFWQRMFIIVALILKICRSFGLVALAVEISRLFNIDSVPWLLVFTLRLIYNEKKQAGQREYTLHSLRRK